MSLSKLDNLIFKLILFKLDKFSITFRPEIFYLEVPNTDTDNLLNF